MSTVLQNLAKEISKQPLLILEIEGIDRYFGSAGVETLWNLDDGYLFDDGLRWDTPVVARNSLDIISPGGTSKSLTQQILPDKEGTSSVATLKIELVDKDQIVTNTLSFNESFQDLLGKKASVYFSYKGATHPTDSLPILYGYVDDYEVQHGSIFVSVSHPENLKRKELFDEYSAVLTQAIDQVETVLNVSITEPLYLSQDILTSYIKIGDEIMLIQSKTSSTITVTRAQFGTIAEDHDLEADISAIYEINGQPIDIALKFMMSSDRPTLFGNQEITSIRFLSVSENIENAIFFEGINVQEIYGLVEGDSVTITESISNDGTYEILGFGSNQIGTWLLTDSPLITEVESTGIANFNSKYSTLPFGLGLTGREVDVAGHEEIDTFNPANFPDYKFFLTEQVNGKEFIDRQVYFPVALFSIPKRARISCKLIQPPLAQNDIIRLDETTISNLSNVKVRRSTHKYLYNTLFYKYNESVVEDRFLSGAIFRNETSLARIQVGTKQMKIESKGLRNNIETNLLLNRQQQRIFDRYKFAAQEITNVEVLTEVGFGIEVGDIVVFGSDNVQLTDFSTGERIFRARLVEVISKNFNVFTGQVTLNLLESAYDLDAKYGVISPSSVIGAGSTTTNLRINLSFSVGEFDTESEKWTPFINERVAIRNEDYTLYQETTFRGISPSNNNIFVIDEISFVPSEGFVMEIPEYPINNLDNLYKDLFVYNNPSVEIVTVLGLDEFTVDDPSLFFVGSPIYVRSFDYSYDSFSLEDVFVDSITGPVIKLNKPLPVGLSSGYFVELIGFPDQGGFPYRIV